MKKISSLQLGLIVAASLIAGFFAGVSVSGWLLRGENLAGSIGKADKYRNVQVTDDDILLRNELVDDTLKRNQYEKYLMYYYYQSLKTTNDVGAVLAKTLDVPDFTDVNDLFVSALKKSEAVAGRARLDILNALNVIINLDNNPNVPVMDELNKANNGIARIRSYDALLLDYMNTIAIYLEAHPTKSYPALQEAHDILAMNVIQSALLTQNKPVLNYLSKKKLLNEQGNVSDITGAYTINVVANQFMTDMENLGAIQNNETLGLVGSSENLQSIVLSGIESLNVVMSNIGQLGLTNGGSFETLNSLIIASQQLQNNLSGFEGLNFVDALHLGIF